MEGYRFREQHKHTHVGQLSHHYQQNKGAVVSNNRIVLKIPPLMGSNEYTIDHKQ